MHLSSLHLSSWCTATCMAPGAGETVVDGLAKAGIAASAVDLPGRGANKDRPICLSESLKVIDEAICALDGPVVLCGHSYGGVPISWAAMRNDRITEVVHLAAILPLEDEIMAGVVEATMERVGHRMRFEDGFSTVASFQDSVDMMYGDCSPEDARWPMTDWFPSLSTECRSQAQPRRPCLVIMRR